MRKSLQRHLAKQNLQMNIPRVRMLPRKKNRLRLTLIIEVIAVSSAGPSLMKASLFFTSVAEGLPEKWIAVCDACKRNSEESLHALLGRLQEGEQRLKKVHTVCVSCTQSPMAEKIKCESLDCAWFYARKQAERDLEAVKGVYGLTEEIERLSFEQSNYFDKSRPQVRRNVTPVSVDEDSE